MSYQCIPCGYKTNRRSNLDRHRQSRKHQRQLLLIGGNGSHHNNNIVNVCNEEIAHEVEGSLVVNETPKIEEPKKLEQQVAAIKRDNISRGRREGDSDRIQAESNVVRSSLQNSEFLRQNYVCETCLRKFTRLYHLQRHQKKARKCQPPAVSKTETTTVKETHNIQFFLPDWLSVDEFIQNLETSHQLTVGETRDLLESFEKNLVSYRSQLSRTLTENCYRQLVDKKAGVDSLEVEEKLGRDHVMGILASPDLNPDQKINQIITISNRQVYNHHQQLIELQIEHQREVVEYLCETLDGSAKNRITAADGVQDGVTMLDSDNTLEKQIGYSHGSEKEEEIREIMEENLELEKLALVRLSDNNHRQMVEERQATRKK